MPRLIITMPARRGITRCWSFIAEKSPRSADLAARIIEEGLAYLKTTPDMGRPVAGRGNRRELLIPFGNSGYIALYRHDPSADAVYILAFRHQKELGY